MNPASKKDLQEAEAILYKPKPHWIIVILPLLLISFSFFLYIIVLPFAGLFTIVGLFLGAFLGLLAGLNGWLALGLLGMAIGGITASIVGPEINHLSAVKIISDIVVWSTVIQFSFFPYIIIAVLKFFRVMIEFFLVNYFITNKRLILKKVKLFSKGFFTTKVKDIPIEKIESIQSEQTLFGILLNYGTLQISGIGGKIFEFYVIKRPKRIRRKIYEVMDKNRRITVIRNNAPKPTTVLREKIVNIDYGVFVSSYPNQEK